MPRTYTVADAMLDTLKAHNVTHIFGYPGGAILPFYDALPYHPEITHILTRNEQGAAFMAQGWARTRKEIGVCCATSGPGATNLVTGIADANLDSVPLLAITGQVPLTSIGKDAFQEVDVVGITMSITKHNYIVERPEDIVPVLTEAIKIATHGRPGPVLVDVPKNIQASEHPAQFAIPHIDIDEGNPNIGAFAGADSSTIDEVVDLLNEAERPVLLLGQGIKYSNAEDEVNDLITKLGIPTVTTILAKGTVDTNNPHYLGMLGMHGFYHCNQAVHNADLILNIGSRFDDRIVGRYDVFGQNKKTIHVDIDRSELNKALPVDLPVHSDAAVFIDQLSAHPDCDTLAIDPWREQIQQWKEAHPYQKRTEIFSMRNCLAALNDEIAKDPERYIVVVDVGQHQMWTSLSCDVAANTQWLSSGGAGTMGFGLPTAIGAAFANPNKTVLCISGDGGIQMNIQELGVLQANPQLDVKVLVMNNEYLGMVRQWQELFYEDNYSAVAMTSPDYAELARAYDLPGYTAQNEIEVASVHERILGGRGPCVVEYRIEKEDNVFPMVPGGKHLGETITSASQPQS